MNSQIKGEAQEKIRANEKERAGGARWSEVRKDFKKAKTP